MNLKINANNSLALVETRYLDNFKDYVDKYLKNLESVPVFLAAIHLFENKNLEIKGFFTHDQESQCDAISV